MATLPTIEIKTRKEAGSHTIRHIYINGAHIPGVTELNVKNKAGDAIDFLEVSLTFLVRDTDLILSQEGKE